MPLWDGNNLGTRDEAVTTETWGRLTNTESNVCGLVAEENGQIIGLVHYILHPTTGSLKPVCYMQDVFTAPDHRRKGVARKMIQHLANLGKGQWARMYWLAESDNDAAQKLYQNLGMKMNFTLHMMRVD